MTPARLEMRSLSKTFGPVRVLDDVELVIEPGEIHGLAGQNGSGKSTLIKILTGLYSPDPGAVYRVDGEQMHLPVRWDQVHHAGVSVVHQDLGLLDQLTVAENICVGAYPRTFGRRIDTAARDDIAARTLARLGVELNPGRPVAGLSAPERAEVAIARALRDHATGSGLLILDESTRALTGDDLVRVHEMLKRVTAEGSSALLISHDLSELRAVADRLTVLRDGRVAGAGLAVCELTEAEIARRMLGGTLGAVDAQRARTTDTATPEEPARTIAVTGLCGGRVEQIEFDLAPGEIVGITGLPGSGYEDIPYLISGAQPARAGQLSIGKERVSLAKAGVTRCLRAGVALVPERRDRDGLALEANVRDNLSLPRLRAQGRPWFVARRWQGAAAASAVDDLDIRPRTTTMLVKQLSGGNQQKVLLGKWLATGPSLLVLHEPTQAVDVGARKDILEALRRAADSGMAVLIVSSEPADLVAVCDRILVHRAGLGLTPADASNADTVIAAVYATEVELSGSPA